MSKTAKRSRPRLNRPGGVIKRSARFARTTFWMGAVGLLPRLSGLNQRVAFFASRELQGFREHRLVDHLAGI